MQYHYVVTAHKPSSVQSAVKGAFIDPSATNLIVAKNHILEIYHDANDSVRLMAEYVLNGQIQTLDVLHPKDRITALILITTSKKQFAVLSWDSMSGKIITESFGSLIERLGRPMDEGTLTAVDPKCRAIAMMAYQGTLKVIPVVADEAMRRSAGRYAKNYCGGSELWPYSTKYSVSATTTEASAVTGTATLPISPTTPTLAMSKVSVVGEKHPSKGKGKAIQGEIAVGDLYSGHLFRIEELKVLDMAFLHGCGKPTIAILHEDNAMIRSVQVYEAHTIINDKLAGVWAQGNVGPTASHILALPRGGALVLGQGFITFIDGDRSKVVVSTGWSDITAHEIIDPHAGERVLVGDDEGVLWVAVLKYSGEGTQLRDICIERLGDMSIPTALVLLSNDRLFIGSHYGDSQLVKLHTDLVPKAAYPALEKLDPWSFGTAAKAWRGNLGAQQFKPAAANSYIEPLVTYPNIGPIIDFCIVSNEGESGQGQIVTCSGSGTKSSLRIIRNGIGIEQVSGQAIQGVLGMWSLLGPSLPGTSPQSQYMVLTFVESTRVLVRREVNDKTIVLKEVDLANTGWSINERSLLVASAGPDVAVNSALAIQVTATSVRLLETESWSLVSQWTPGTIDSVSSLPGRITAASTNGSQVAVAVAKGIIVYLEVRGLNLVECDQTKLDNEVACLDIHSFTSNKLTGRSHYILVTTWCDNIVRLLSLPSLNVASEIKLDPELPLPRSVLMCQIGGVKYAMVGLGDGQLLHYVCDVVPTDNDNATAAAAPAVRLRDQRKVMLGTRPLRLIPFLNEGSLHVLVVSDRPAVIFSHHCKLMYSNVNVKSITFACAFSTQDAPNLLCLADPVSLTANKIDPIQKLHIRCVPLPRNDSPNRIAHQPSSRTFGVCTTSLCAENQFSTSLSVSSGLGADTATVSGLPPYEVGKFVLLDDQTFEALASIELKPFELPESVCVVSLRCLEGPERTAKQAKSDSVQGRGQQQQQQYHSHHYHQRGADMETQRPGPAETCDEFYAVGTAITKPSDDNSNEGRILLLKWDPKTRRLVTVDEYTTKGAVFSIQPFKGMLAAVSNNVLLLLGWERTTASSKGKSHAALHSPTSAEASSSGGGGGGDMSKDDEDYCLKVLCTHPTHVVSIGLVVQGDFLAVGDIMSSAALFKHSYDSDTGKHTLAEIARDHGANWTTAIAALPKPRTPADLSAQQQGQAKEQLSLPPSMLGNPTDERFIVGENGMNLFKVRQDTSSTAEYNRRQLKVEGRWHLGDLVNQIKPGSLVMDIPDPDLPIYPRLIYATLKGALGVVANIESNKCGRILDRLQANMGHLLPSVGCLPHEKWRTFENPSRTALPFGFIDGDLVETFLDLPMETQLYVFHGKRSPCATPLSVAGSPIQVESEGSGASVERLGRDDKGKDKMPEESPEAGGQRKRKEPSHTTSQEELAAQSSDNQGRDAVSRAADQLAGSSAHGFSMRASNLVQRPPNQRHFYLPDESPLANEVIKTVTDIGAEEHISLLDLIRMVESLSRLH